MANISFDGNIGKTAELRTVQNGERQDSVTSIWVAENKKKRDKKTGEMITVAKWHKVTLWRGFAESLAPYLTAGRHVLVEGDGFATHYVNRANQIVDYIDVTASKLKLLDRKAGEDVPDGNGEENEPVVVETPWDEE